MRSVKTLQRLGGSFGQNDVRKGELKKGILDRQRQVSEFTLVRDAFLSEPRRSQSW